MDIHERINAYLREKKISKKEFAQKLIASNAILKNTGEVPSEATIYVYLNGRIGMKAELIPYIAEILDIPEQLFFDENVKKRMKLLKYLSSSLSSSERDYLEKQIGLRTMENDSSVYRGRLKEITELLNYAPEAFLEKLEDALREYKRMTEKFTKNF